MLLQRYFAYDLCHFRGDDLHLMKMYLFCVFLILRQILVHDDSYNSVEVSFFMLGCLLACQNEKLDYSLLHFIIANFYKYLVSNFALLYKEYI